MAARGALDLELDAIRARLDKLEGKRQKAPKAEPEPVKDPAPAVDK